MSILGPGGELTAPETRQDKIAAPFGLAALVILDLASPQNQTRKNIFSSLTALDLNGTLVAAIKDQGAIRLSEAHHIYPSLNVLKLRKNLSLIHI